MINWHETYSKQLQSNDPDWWRIKNKVNMLLAVAGLNHKDPKYDFTVEGKEVLPIASSRKDIKISKKIR